MAKVPAFWFYPGDWLRAGSLHRCSPAARGLWVDMLCRMHDSETECSLESGGTPWTDAEIVKASSGHPKTLRLALQELIGKGVAKRNENGAIYSGRLERDAATRRARAVSGSKGGSAKEANRVANSYQIPDSDNDNDKKNTRNSLRDWVIARWYPSGVTETDAETITETLDGLELKGGTTVRCEVVCKRFAAKWPDATLTPRAMLKYWDTFLQEPAAERTVTPGVNRQDDAELQAEMRQETVQKWCAGLDEFTRARLWKETRAGMLAKAVEADVLAECDASTALQSEWMYHHECLRLGHGPEYERAAK